MRRKSVKLIDITANICKALSLAGLLLVLAVVFLTAPIMFGLHAFSVKQSDCTDYPVDALAYYVYTPAETYAAGDRAAIRTERGITVLTLTGHDPETRVWHTSGEFRAYRDVPYEYLEGKVCAVCLPNLGLFAEERTTLLISGSVVGLLFYALSRQLPKKFYVPKYGKKTEAADTTDSGETEHETDT